MEKFTPEQIKYLELLARQFPTQEDVFTEIINLQAIINLPKGTEHFMSDLHGEFEAFQHILNNCSGVIREKVDLLYSKTLPPEMRAELLTLIYYPKEKLDQLERAGRFTDDWSQRTIHYLLKIAKLLSSKYTRSKVRKAMPKVFGYVMDELLHAQTDENNNQFVYHAKILESILETDSTRSFIYALADLIKRLAVDHLHIIGDIYDRGPHGDKIMDKLMQHHSLDIQWGNHDVLWMGAAAGSDACIMNVLRNNVRYHNLDILESGYGISLRPLAIFAHDMYRADDGMDPMVKAINVMLFKLEGQIIERHPEYHMEDRQLLEKIDLKDGTVTIPMGTYPLKTTDFPTLDLEHPYKLSDEEHEIMHEVRRGFLESERLQKHIGFFYSHGSMYECYNGNLLFHGGVPLDVDGSFAEIFIEGKKYAGRALMDRTDFMCRRAFEKRDQSALDYIWYLWCGSDSPVSGRVMKTFERSYITDEATWKEPQNAYYRLNKDPKICDMILREFGLDPEKGHIINGHTPVKVKKGESPVKAGGKALCIDGGFCRAYHGSTGIAGYTLIYNSHGYRIKAHYPFADVEHVLSSNADIDSDTVTIEEEKDRIMIGDTDNGQRLKVMIEDLKDLLVAYRQGIILEKPGTAKK